MNETHRSDAAAQNKIRIEKSVLAFCGQAGLFAPERAGRRVVAAVSGGADSMALLRILLALQQPLGIRVEACHVNHGLRGAAADADEAFVRRQCAQLGVPLTVYNARQMEEPPPAHAGEDWARRLRYRVFGQLAMAGDTLVATAHTLTDQTETLLFRLARGTGVHGAAGIPARREVYVRPLLGLTRADTEAYCAAVGQPYVTDETNLCDDYARNRLRHYAVPALEQANSAAQRNMGRFCEKMARIDAYFVREGFNLLQTAHEAAGIPGNPFDGPWQLQPLQAADPLLTESALHILLPALRDPEEKTIRAAYRAVQAGRGAVLLSEQVQLAAADGLLQLQLLPQEAAQPPAGYCKPFSCGEHRLPGGYRLQIGIFQADILQNIPLVHKKDLKSMADYAKITELECMLRTRQPGDEFRPAGRGVTKSLKKYYNELHLSALQRQTMPLLAAGNRVLWLWDQGFAEGLAPNADTRTIVWIEQKKTEETEA